MRWGYFKRGVVSFILILFTTTIQAEEADLHNTCKTFAQTVSVAQINRQNNVPLVDTVEQFNGEFIDFILVAYDAPVFETEVNKRSIIIEFYNNVYKWCLKHAFEELKQRD